jgi:hypothetical protein
MHFLKLFFGNLSFLKSIICNGMFFCFISVFYAQAQPILNSQIVKSQSNFANGTLHDVAVNAAGESFVIGGIDVGLGLVFGNQVEDIFLLKLNNNGNVLSSKSIKTIDNFGKQSIALSNSGNNYIYFGGSFKGQNVDFGGKILSADCGTDPNCRAGYIAVATPNLVLQGGVLADEVYKRKIVQAIDFGNGEVYVTVHDLRNPNVPTIFLQKYSTPSLTLLWEKNLGTGYAYSLDFDNVSNAVYVGGTFSGANNFGGTTNFNSANGAGFVAKFDVLGNFQAAAQVANPNISGTTPHRESVQDLTVQYGKVFLTGSGAFEGPLGFTDVVLINVLNTSNLSQDVNFGSPLIIGDGFSTSGRGTAIGVYNFDLLVTGYVYGSNVEFNPRNLSQPQSVSTSTFNTFVAKYDLAGICKTAKGIMSSLPSQGNSLAFTNDSYYLAGTFRGTANFNPFCGNAISLASQSTVSNDGFLIKYDNFIDVPILNGPSSSLPGETEEYYISPLVAGATSYNWYIPSGNGWQINYISSDKSYIFVTIGNTSGDIGVTASDPCRTSNIRKLTVNVGSGLRAMSIYPNPSSDILNVEVQASSNNITSLELLNGMGETVKSTNLPADETKAFFIISELKEGLYLLKVKRGNEINQKHIMIKH